MGPRKKKTYEYVIDMIKEMLIQNQLVEGQKLPNQVEFARQLEVSRLSLREALKSLESMGVVEQKPKTGTIIISADPSKWNEPAIPPLLSDSEATYELIEARRIIEVVMATQAAENITDDQLETLEKIITKMMIARNADDHKEYSKVDLDFHIVIANAANNRYLLNMYMATISLMEELIQEINEYIPQIKDDSIKTHKKIFEALRKRDKKEVGKWMDIHISRVAQYYEEYISNQPTNLGIR